MDEFIAGILEDADKIAELSGKELADAKEALRKMGVTLHANLSDSENPEEDAEALEAIADRIDAINERLAAVEAEETAKAERLAATMDRIGALEEDDTTEEEVETLSEDTEEAAEVAEVVAEDSDDDVEAEESVTEEVEPVVASAPKVSAGARARLANINKAKPAAATPAPQEEAPKFRASLVAGGAVETGPDEYGDAVELAQSFIDVHNRVAGIGKSTGRHQVAKLNVARPATLGDNSMENYLAVTGMQKDLERGKTDALTASGGFCAPSETMYDFFDVSSTDGLLQLPTMTARRGKVNIPTSPSMQNILGDVSADSWGEAVASVWDEATDITPGGATKPCYHIECAAFGEFAVEARVLCLTFGNFQQQFYPELVADTLAKSLVAHEHLVNAGLIADIVALADSTGPIPSPGGGALSAVLGTLAFKAAQYREKYRMPRTATLTAVLPYWVRDAMVADYVRRASTVDPSAVSGAIDSYFADRNINPQWVYDWQGLADDQVGGPKVEFPGTADILLYAEGTVVRLDAPTLDFGIVRDSTLNSVNDWQQFVEQFVGIAKIGHEVMLIEDVETCPTGETGQAIDLSCIGS